MRHDHHRIIKGGERVELASIAEATCWRHLTVFHRAYMQTNYILYRFGIMTTATSDLFSH
eukprot:2351297-Amphidinium_carterae.1